jgi:hypothetical protein
LPLHQSYISKQDKCEKKEDIAKIEIFESSICKFLVLFLCRY